MKYFDYDLVKDPAYFSDNRIAAHSDHKYFENMEKLEQNVDDFR